MKGRTTILREETFDIASLREEEIPQALKKRLKEKNISSDFLILGLPRTQITIRHLSLPSVNAHEIKKMVEYELSGLFPLKPEELIYDHAIIEKGTDNYSRLILAAAPREEILKQINLLEKAGLSTDVVKISTASLFNEFLFKNYREGNNLLIYRDSSSIEMLLISAGRLAFSRGWNFNSNLNIADILKEMGTTVRILRDKGTTIDKAFLTGEETNTESFKNELEKAIAFDFEICTPLNLWQGFIAKENDTSLKIDLLPEETKLQILKKKKRKSLIILGVLVFLNVSLIANILFFGIKARREYLSLLQAELDKLAAPAALLENKIASLNTINSYLSSSRLTLGALSELYRLAPQGIQLSSLDILTQKTPGVMTIAGLAKSAELVHNFARALRESPLIEKADVGSIAKAQTDTQEEMVTFEIKSYLGNAQEK